jgi:hypothetical protein
MNCSNPGTAEAAAYRIPDQIEPAAARKLLLTAAARQHTAAVQHMIGLPVLQQHVDADTLEATLTLLLGSLATMQQLCVLPAAGQLSSEAVVRLLRIAIPMRSFLAIEQLCSLAGAQQLSSLQIAGLLGAFAQGGNNAPAVVWCLAPILQLPAVAAPSSDACVEFLEAVVKQEPSSLNTLGSRGSHTHATIAMVGRLLTLPAAAELSNSQVAQLLTAAAVNGSSACLSCMLRMAPTAMIAGRLSSEMLSQVLQQAVERGSEPCSMLLCELPAAQQLSCESMEGLLAAAIASKSLLCTWKLCLLPAAQQLSCEALVRLLVAAKQSGAACAGALRMLPTAAAAVQEVGGATSLKETLTAVIQLLEEGRQKALEDFVGSYV